MLKNIEKNIILTMIIILLFGLLLIFQSRDFFTTINMTINYAIVVAFAIIGVIQIISYMFSNDYKNNNYYGLIIGIVSVWISLVFYKKLDDLFVELFILFVPAMTALYAYIMFALSLMKFITTKNKLYIIIFIFSLIMGFILIFMPFDNFDYFKVSGIYLVIASIINIVYTIVLNKGNKQVKERKNG